MYDSIKGELYKVVEGVGRRAISDVISYANSSIHNMYGKRYGNFDHYSSSKRVKRSSYGGGSYKGKLVPGCSYGNKTLKSKPCVVTHKELSSTVTDPDVCFITIGVNYEHLTREICKAMLYVVMKESGDNIVNYADVIGYAGRLDIAYFTAPTSTTLTVDMSITWLSSTTFGAVATSLFTWFQNLASGSVIKIKKISVLDTNNAVATYKSQVDMSALYLNIDLYQTLLVQNITDGSGATDDQTTSVNANPLYCNVYDANSNIVYQKGRNTDASFLPWVHYNDSYPEVQTRTAAANFPAGATINQLGDFFINAKRKYRAVIQPGAMQKVHLAHHYNGYINNLIMKMVDPVTGYNLPSFIPGKQRIIGFDKMIKNGQAVEVAYELNQKSAVSYKLKNKRQIVPLFE